MADSSDFLRKIEQAKRLLGGPIDGLTKERLLSLLTDLQQQLDTHKESNDGASPRAAE
jgi:hypothetical protein